MLWSQYKLAMIRRTEFLRKEITGIPNIANRSSDFLTLQTSELKKKPTGIFGTKYGIGIPLTMGVPEIGTKNWNSQPSIEGIRQLFTNFYLQRKFSIFLRNNRDCKVVDPYNRLPQD